VNLTKENVRKFLGWSSVINLGLLLYWILVITLGNEFVFQIHNWWFDIPHDRFDEIHYTMMGYYKLMVILFNVTPYLVLRFVKFVPETSTDKE
jgi:NADH:ubiquinone oxidoreductase subunit 2 (subunit N)